MHKTIHNTAGFKFNNLMKYYSPLFCPSSCIFHALVSRHEIKIAKICKVKGINFTKNITTCDLPKLKAKKSNGQPMG